MMIGILGGGQLGRMMALAGYPLGLRFRFLDQAPDAPAGQLAELVIGEADDARFLDEFAQGLAVVTYEFENVPLSSARFLSRHVAVHPSPAALEASQDRLNEKELFRYLGIPTAPFAAVSSPADFETALDTTGLPAILKTRRFGYDGKGQVVIREREELAAAWDSLGNVDAVLEGFVSFERELSILAVRSSLGETAFYPLVQNFHRDGILRLSLAPAPESAPESDAKTTKTNGRGGGQIVSMAPPSMLFSVLEEQAHTFASRVLDHLDYVGVLAIELFQTHDGLVANEMAPRVHNSGHWTIEGAETSQFENHLRAILGMPLGSTQPRGFSAMVNLIGETPDRAAMLAVDGAHVHLYGKEPRAGRKVGHVTVCADTREQLAERLAPLQMIVD